MALGLKGGKREKSLKSGGNLAGPTRLELATSGVTGRRSNRLNYDPAVELLQPLLNHKLAAAVTKSLTKAR